MGVTSFLVNYLQVSALLFALDHYPENTPRRWEAIAAYIEIMKPDAGYEEDLETFTLTYSNAPKRIKKVFTGSANECQQLAIILKSYYPYLVNNVKQLYRPLLSNADRNSPLKPIILTPPISQCCDSTLISRNRPSFPIVYTTMGTYIAASYHSICCHCRKVYYPSHYEVPHENTAVFYDVSKHTGYLQISSQTVFEISYLERVTNELSICSTTFEALADAYTMNNLEQDKDRLQHLQSFSRCQSDVAPWMLNAQRLEEGWFILKLCQFHQSRGDYSMNFHTELVNGRKDIEQLCKAAYEVFSTEVPQWIHHKCSVTGCTTGYATLDGNEKITRTMCSAPHSKVYIPSGGVSVMSCCPNTPALGGNKVKGSKYCPSHQNLEDTRGDGSPLDLSHDPDNARFKAFSANDIHNETDLQASESDVGCRKPGNISKYYDRTAGIAAIVRPCGIVINWTEMYSHESLTQMYLFLIFTFDRGKDVERLKYLGYDRACGLHPFIRNLAERDVMFAKYFLKHVHFLVDRFHVSKHTEKCCIPVANNPDCKYNPDLPEFEEVSGVNTECAEQAFRWLNKLKYSVRQMSRYRYNFFLHELINVHNRLRELKLKSIGKL